MIRFGRILAHRLVLPIVAAAAFCSFSSAPARADSLTLLTQNLEHGAVVCTNSSTPTASCGTSAQSTGSLANGTLGVVAQFPPDGLPLPNEINETSVEALASASLQYDFTSNVASGTAVFNLAVNGTISVSNTLATGPFSLPAPCSLAPCQAGAGIEIPNDLGEAFVGLPGEQYYSLSDIQNSGNASGPYTVQISVPVNNGSVDFDVSLAAFAECPSLTAEERAFGESCSAVADYLDPFTITGASVYGPNGNLIPGATLISQTGFSPAPEPSSLLLLGSGVALLGLGWSRMRIQKSL